MGLMHLHCHRSFMPAIVGMFIFLSSMLVEAAPLMPDVMGLTLEEARQTLDKRGLKIDSIREQRTNRPAGQVIVQSPRAGLQVIAGTPVRLVVAIPLQKLKQTKVPNLKGLSLDEVKTALAQAQLRLGNIKQRKMAVEHEYVLYQSPHAGKNLVVNSAVNITLSDPLPITGPRVKLRLDKTQYAVGEAIVLYADILNPLANQTPRYSFTINGRAIPSKGSTMVYRAEKAGKYVISASARYGRNPWIASLSRSIYVQAGDVAEGKNANEDEQKPVKQSDKEKLVDQEEEKQVEKWIKPKAVIYPESLTVKRGKSAAFYSRSTATKQSGLDYRWMIPSGVVNGERQVSFDTSSLEKNEYLIKLRVKDDRGLVDTVTAKLVLTGEIVKADDTNVPKALVDEKPKEDVDGSKSDGPEKQASDSVAENPLKDESDPSEAGSEDKEKKSDTPENIQNLQNDEKEEQITLAEVSGENDRTQPLTSPGSEQQELLPTTSLLDEQQGQSLERTEESIEEVANEMPEKESVQQDEAFSNTENAGKKGMDTSVMNKPIVGEVVGNRHEEKQTETSSNKQQDKQASIESIRLKASSVQVLVGNEVKFNIEPVSAVSKEDFELIIEEQNAVVYLPLINARYAFKKDGTYTLYAKVVDANNKYVETDRIVIRVWPVWLPILIALVGGFLTLLHFRIKKKQKAR
jgi:hypothetical protein